MSSEASFGQGSFSVAVVPARAAYLVQQGSRAGLHRAVCEATTRWAGLTEPIIPVRSNGSVDPLWLKVLGWADIAGLVNVDVDPGIAARLGATVNSEVTALALVDDRGRTRFTSHPTSIASVKAPAQIDVALARTGADLWEAVAVGDVTTVHEPQVTNETDPAYIRSHVIQEAMSRQLRHATSIEHTVHQFSEHARFGGTNGGCAVVWLTQPNHFGDCLAFWNLRALRPLGMGDLPTLLLHPGSVTDWKSLKVDLDAALSQLDTESSPDVIITSRSVKPDAQDEVAAELGLKPAADERISATMTFGRSSKKTSPFSYLRRDPYWFVAAKRKYGWQTSVVTQLHRAETRLRSDSPVAFKYSAMAMTTVGSRSLDPYPKQAAVAGLLHPNGFWLDDRLSVGGRSSSRVDLTLNLPDLPEVVWALLNSRVESAELSDKGKLGERIYELGLGPPLLTQGAVESINDLRTPRSKELERALRRMKASGAPPDDITELASVWGGRVERRFRKSSVLKNYLAAVETLASEGWIERGLGIDCDRCGLKTFVPLSSASDEPRCTACGASQSFLRDKTQIDIFYRLNALVDRASDQGVVPHLQAAAALKHDRPWTSMLLGVDLVFADSSVAEVDLFGISNGQVLAGEVKTSPQEFDRAQLQRDVEISKRLEVDVHVIASPQSLPAAAIGTLATLLAPTGISLLRVEGHRVLPFPTN